MADELNPLMVSAKWQELALVARVLEERLDGTGALECQPGSSLADDDAASSPYLLTTAVHCNITAAVDHLHALTSLVVDQERLHVHAPGSLSRGLLEAGGMAFWILHPSDQDERLKRAQDWYHRNAQEQEQAVGGLGVGGATLAEVDARLRESADRRGLGSPRWLKSQKVIAYADRHADVESVLLSWRLCSAFAHGFPWAGMSLHDKTVVPGAPEGTVYLRMTNRLDSALFPALTGALLLQEVLRRYDERRRADT